MPDDINNEEVEAGDEGGGKKKSGMLVVILLVLNFLLVGGLGAYFLLFSGGAEEGEEGAEATSEEGGGAGESGKKAAGMGPIVELDPFLVNLDEPGSNRYLKAVVQVEVTTPEAQKEVKDKNVMLRDQIITYLSSLNYSQTQGVVNKDIIRTTLIKHINDKLAAGQVKKLYFTEFVIQ